MTRRASSAGVVPRVPRKDAHCAIRAALRCYVGPGRPWKSVDLAEEAGVPVRTIECAIAEVGSEHWRPLAVERLLSIATVLGPDFTSLWLALARQGAFTFSGADVPAAGEIIATMASDLAQVTGIFADNVVTPEEMPILVAVASRKPTTGGHLMRLAQS